MSTLNSGYNRSSPSVGAVFGAKVARIWQDVQNGFARIIGFKDSGKLAGAVTGGGIVTIAAATTIPLLAPLLAIGNAATVAGILGLAENKVTNNIAKWDGRPV